MKHLTAEQLETSAQEAFRAAFAKLVTTEEIPENYFTSTQWAAKLGKSKARTRDNLSRLYEAGLADRREVVIAGHKRRVYKLK